MTEERDPVTGMTVEELQQAAQEAYAAREDDSAWEEVDAEVSAQARSVVSVRFGPEELAAVERAASQAGLAVSTYIRNAALAGADALDLDSVRRAARALLQALDQDERDRRRADLHAHEVVDEELDLEEIVERALREPLGAEHHRASSLEQVGGLLVEGEVDAGRLLAQLHEVEQVELVVRVLREVQDVVVALGQDRRDALVLGGRPRRERAREPGEQGLHRGRIGSLYPFAIKRVRCVQAGSSAARGRPRRRAARPDGRRGLV